MTISQLQDYTFITRYARHRADLGRRETWEEATDRVMDMHAQRYPQIAAELGLARAAMRERLVLGSQRALQFGGKAIEDKHARLYNCTVSYADRTRFFQEALWLLLCGCGVGFSVQRHHVDRLPPIRRPGQPALTHVVADSIEGWADALGALIGSYTGPGAATVAFDYGLIRPAGAPLGSGMGVAPGPAPLMRSLDRIRALLDSRLADAAAVRLRPIDVYDIVMHASDAVLAGGVRRSATICVFSADDREMAGAKTGDWFLANPQRGRSNNSALLLRRGTSRERFAELMRAVREYGEPGFIWADSTEIMFNPCGEIGMWPVDEPTGRSGWAFCNLCEINVKACRDEADLARACRAAAILGTVQAGYTSFPYLGATTERIVAREALLGVSMTGMMDAPELAFDPGVQERMARLIVAVNAELAPRIGIRPAARTTCIKPAGTTSCILGTASGIHPHHAKRYFRRVQARSGEAPLAWFKERNPRAVERSVWNPNGTDEVITFCVEVPAAARVRDEVGAVPLLDAVLATKRHWIDAGRVDERCVRPWLSHNVSNTVTVREGEWQAVEEWIWTHRQEVAGIALLAEGGELDYPQAPFSSVWTYDEIMREFGIGSLFASGLIVDGMHAFAEDLWAACDCALGRGAPLDLPAIAAGADPAAVAAQVRDLMGKRDWVRRARQFAARYVQGDLRRMTHLLKRVHLCKLWEDLQREYRPVDWVALHERRDDTRPAEAVACAGGSCALV